MAYVDGCMQVALLDETCILSDRLHINRDRGDGRVIDNLLLCLQRLNLSCSLTAAPRKSGCETAPFPRLWIEASLPQMGQKL